MASSKEFVNYVMDQIQGSGRIKQIKMMGEHCIYCDDLVIGLIIADTFYLKQTPSNSDLVGKAKLVPPYPGAKPSFLIENVDDREFLTRIVRNTVFDLQQQNNRRSRSR